MNTTLSRIAITALLFLLIFGSGFWLSRSGRPLNTLLLTAHKLIALGALIFLAMTVYRVYRADGLSTGVWIASALTVALFIDTIVTGGLLSTGSEMPGFVLTMHQVTPFLTLIASGITLALVL